MVAKKKATILLVLDKHKINSVDLRMKIFGNCFVSRGPNELLFKKGSFCNYKQPGKWDWEHVDHILDVPFGGLCALSKKGFPVNWSESKWLREACYLLGITYYDGGPSSKRGFRKCRIVIPEGWQFDPDKPVDEEDWSICSCSSCCCYVTGDKFRDLDFHRDVYDYEYSSALRGGNGIESD